MPGAAGALVEDAEAGDGEAVTRPEEPLAARVDRRISEARPGEYLISRGRHSVWRTREPAGAAGVADERLPHGDDLVAVSQPDPEVPVASHREVFVESAGLEQGRPAHHGDAP